MSDTRAVSRLASARLVVPMPSRRLVRRARVTRLLDREVGDHPVTVVTAGPGTGKTFAVADWVREGHPPGPVAWLSLDPVVRTPVRFWSSVLGALTATLGEGALGALRTPAVVDEDFVEVLAERLGGVGVVLVLDDVHELPPEVVDGVDQLLRVPPAGLHVVLISRHDPPLSLHRHRLAGRLGEVRAHDLAFDAGEVHELLREEGVDLDDIGVQRLLTISQGWAAGLRLAVLSLSRAADPAQALQRFGGQQPLVASYLGEELLGGLSAERATFLLRTCVPDRICGPLATVLTGDPAAPGLLASVFTDDLMVVELEGSGWFRYHPLLQQLLRHRLHRDHPSLEAELHGRASAWFERSGEWLTALDHAVRGGDLDRVAQVALRSASVMVFSGDRAPLATAIAALDPASATHRPDLLVVLAVGAFCGGQHDLTASLLARAEAGLGALPPDRERLATLNLRVLQALEARRLGDETALRSCAEAAVRLCEELAPEEAPGWARFRGAAVAVVAVGRLWSGRPQAALEALRQARTFDPGARHPGYPEVYYAGYLGLALLLRGEVAEARAAATRALGQAEAMGTQRSHETGPAWLTLALAELQGGREDAALAAAATGCPAATGWTPSWPPCCGSPGCGPTPSPGTAPLRNGSWGRPTGSSRHTRGWCMPQPCAPPRPWSSRCGPAGWTAPRRCCTPGPAWPASTVSTTRWRWRGRGCCWRRDTRSRSGRPWVPRSSGPPGRARPPGCSWLWPRTGCGTTHGRSRPWRGPWTWPPRGSWCFRSASPAHAGARC